MGAVLLWWALALVEASAHKSWPKAARVERMCFGGPAGLTRTMAWLDVLYFVLRMPSYFALLGQLALEGFRLGNGNSLLDGSNGFGCRYKCCREPGQHRAPIPYPF